MTSVNRPAVVAVIVAACAGAAGAMYLLSSDDASPAREISKATGGAELANVAASPAHPAPRGGAAVGSAATFRGRWQHVDTRIKFTCTGSPEKEKEAKGETFTIEAGAAPGELLYADNDCTLRLGISGDQASVLPDQNCGQQRAFHYDTLTVTLSGADSARLEGRGVFRIDGKDQLLECSFQATGLAKKMPS